MWGVKVVSLFLGCLEETQEAEVGCGNLNAATCAYMPTVRYTFQSCKVCKHENTLIMLMCLKYSCVKLHNVYNIKHALFQLHLSHFYSRSHSHRKR